jgi:hypothetical protein
VVAVALKFTGELTVLSFAGSVTVTPANAAGANKAVKQTNSDKDFSIKPSPNMDLLNFRTAELQLFKADRCAGGRDVVRKEVVCEAYG